MQPFHQRGRPGDLTIPAIRTIGGSLLYFVETGQEAGMWQHEFQPDGDGIPQPNAGLLRVDHVAQSMHYEEMLSWLLYYVALFDMDKTPQLDIIDPLGLVQSQAVESRDRTLRVTMNCSAGNQTAAARFLNAYVGPGVQHIALDTADIFAAAAFMRDSGVELLPIPRNYYEDLESRFGLDVDLIGKMASLNILYDREADGEYFQVYSRTFADRFFFEVVQRSGYQAYGAANAPIRLAAQGRDRISEEF
jgi:4-hydroxyphenylpyruvate dioxygenase